MSHSLAELVSDLPEIYQAIYGHPDIAQETSRACTDRLDHIAEVYDALSAHLGRPLRVLDMGCAQGFFSLSLAARGADVHGVDFLDKNILVCQALAQENPTLKATFAVGRLEDTVAALQPDQYDLILGLSVLHHVVHEHGVPQVQDWLRHVAEVSKAAVFELALREEPLYWGPSQPAHYLELLHGYAFIHELGLFGTHLSGIERPLLVASNDYWVSGPVAARIERWSTEPHSLANGTHQGSRRYYWADGAFAKVIRFDGERGPLNRAEYERELAFLSHPSQGFDAPRLLSHLVGPNEGMLVMERLDGRLLLDVIQQNEPFDVMTVLKEVLQQLAALEAAGLYHQDVRTWNLMQLDNGKTQLIDFGSIAPQARDCVWPDDIFLAFLILVHELSSGRVDDPSSRRAVSISPYALDEPLRGWAVSFWNRPLAQWTFKGLLDALVEGPGNLPLAKDVYPADVWTTSLEQVVQAQKLHMAYLEETIANGRLYQLQADDKIRRLEEWSAQINAQLPVLYQHSEQISVLDGRLQQLEWSLHQKQDELTALYLSSSWTVTKPLRWASRKLARLIRR